MVQVRILAAERGPAVTEVPGEQPSVDDEDQDGGVPLSGEVDDPTSGAMPGYGEISEAWLLGRARELVAVAQRSDPTTQREFLGELDDLLGECRRRADPMVVGQMLRSALLVRMEIPGYPGHEVDVVLDELVAHARRHSLVVLEAGAHALRARQILHGVYEDDDETAGMPAPTTGALGTTEDAAIAAIARALAMLDDDSGEDRTRNYRGWQRMYSAVLVELALTLTELGMYEEANQAMARADLAVTAGGGPHEITIHLINRVRIQLHWALRLERVGDKVGAAERIKTGAAMASAAEVPFRQSLFPRDPDLTAAEQIPELGAALALHDPGPQHLGRLRGLVPASRNAPQFILVTIALARCLARASQVEDALEALADARSQLENDPAEQALRLSLTREIGQLAAADHNADPELTVGALREYVSELEDELWTIRSSRIATLSARREHDRLSREHGAIAQQALQDPLTGLPNRRALDERLDELINRPGGQPVAIALVDLDRFKGVNDQSSHAEGDDVLRLVANTLRQALRGGDLVARYGGDEFVALLPGAPLPAAERALQRAANAVAELPEHLAYGVTLSVGVVALRQNETAASALARADAAMYVAKRGGGNSVAAISGNPPAADAASAAGSASGLSTALSGSLSDFASGSMSSITFDPIATDDDSAGGSHYAEPDPEADPGPAWVPPDAP